MPDDTPLMLVTISSGDDWLARLRAAAPALRVEEVAPEAVTPEQWRRAEIVYWSGGALPAPERVPVLRWVQLHSAGANRVVAEPLFHTDVVFTTASGIHAINIAEHVFAMLLAWTHHVPRLLEWQARREWPPDEQRWPLFVPQELWGKTLGIAGYGSIGRQIARVAKGFGMRVRALQHSDDPQDRGFSLPGVGDREGAIPERYYRPEELFEMLAACDFVVIALPLTPQTRSLFDERAFAAMKPGAFLVNIARGEVCDEQALGRALHDGRLAGAALDVFVTEPLPPESPLWTLPNVLLSPHIAGFTPEYDNRGMRVFMENLQHYLAGEPLVNVVDKRLGF
jgi:phosphoglycerate dehydrogenase-like enzyme